MKQTCLKKSGKKLWEKEKMFVTSIVSFPTMFFESFLSQVVQTCDGWIKDWIFYTIILPFWNIITSLHNLIMSVTKFIFISTLWYFDSCSLLEKGRVGGVDECLPHFSPIQTNWSTNGRTDCQPNDTQAYKRKTIGSKTNGILFWVILSHESHDIGMISGETRSKFTTLT